MHRTLATLALVLCFSPHSYAFTKCQSAGKVMYVDTACPPGFSTVTTSSDLVSAVGAQRQDAEAPKRRTDEGQQFQPLIAEEQQQSGSTRDQPPATCASLEDAARSIAQAMRGTNTAQVSDMLRVRHAAIRDQQARMGCGR